MASLVFPLCALFLAADPIFSLDFEGYPAKITGSSGEEKTFDVFCRLTSSVSGADGAAGWSISLGIEGGEITNIALLGVLVNTIYDEDDDKNPVTPPIHHDNYVQNLGGNVSFQFKNLAFHKDDPNRKGAVSAIVLRNTELMALHPNSRDRIARLTVKVTVPAISGQVTLRYENGFKTSTSQPVDNSVVVDSLSYNSQLGSCAIPVLAVSESLQLDVPQDFSLTASGTRKFFKLDAPAGTSAAITLADPDPLDGNALYLRWGDLPETDRFDQAADARNQANQKLVVPSFRNETAYLLVQAGRINGGSNDITLLARAEVLALVKTSTNSQGLGGSGRLDMGISGAGFGPDTVFALRHQGTGETREAIEMTIVSSEHAEVTFQLLGAPVGNYDLKAANPGGIEATLEDAFKLLDTILGPILKVELSSPDRCRFDRLGRITLRYSNAGDQEMAAPLFKVVGPEGSQLRLETEEEFQENVIQVLGINPTGVAGRLSPGASGEIPIIFRNPGENEARFQVHLFSPKPDDKADWESVAMPAGMSPADWEALCPRLPAKLGATWIDFQKALSERATRLARRGVNVSAVRELFRFAAREALGRPASALVGRVRDGASGAPLEGKTVLALRGGEVLSSAASGKEGNFTLDWLAAGITYEIRLVDASASVLEVTLPADGDSLGMDLQVTAEANGLEAQCPNCDEAGLPSRPPLPPEPLFTQKSERSLQVIRSWDPNEKEGPAGEDVEKDEEIVYSIFFENLPVATAWAQKVVVTDQLDPDLDWSTFRLRDIILGGEKIALLDRRDDARGLRIMSDGFGGGKVFERMGPSGEWLLHSYCEFDPQAGLARWTFLTLDPATGLLPDSFEFPDAGFLPPNDETKRGEGQLVFSVSPKAGLDDGTELANEAEISFDFLPPLRTEAVTQRFRRPFKKGDANADGFPDLSDVILGLAHLFLGGEEPPCRKSLDVNGDGAADLSDQIYMLFYIFLGEKAPEEPFSACGLNSVNLGCKSYRPCGE